MPRDLPSTEATVGRHQPTDRFARHAEGRAERDGNERQHDAQLHQLLCDLRGVAIDELRKEHHEKQQYLGVQQAVQHHAHENRIQLCLDGGVDRHTPGDRMTWCAIQSR